MFMPIFTADDAFLIEYARRLVHNNDSHITFLDPNGAIRDNSEIFEHISRIKSQVPDNITMMEDRMMKREFLEKQDIILVSLDNWKKLVNSQSTWLENIPSVLIIKP